MSRGIRRGAGPLEHAREEIFMTVQEVAEYLNCHAGTVYRLVRQREIPCFKLGGSWRFRRSDLEQWIRDRQQKAEDAGGRATVESSFSVKDIHSG